MRFVRSGRLSRYGARPTRAGGPVGGGGGGGDISAAILALGPVLYAKHDDPAVGGPETIVDYSTNANNGTATNSDALMQLQAGPDGNLYMEGNGIRNANNYVSFPNISAYPDNTGAMSVFCLAKATDLSLNTREDIAYSSNLWFFGRFFNRLQFFTLNASATSAQGATAVDDQFVLNEWVGLAATVGDPADVTTFKLFANSGTPVTDDDSTVGAPNTGAASNIFTHVYHGSSYDPFHGAIAHFAVFDKELTEAEVAGLMSEASAAGWF